MKKKYEHDESGKWELCEVGRVLIEPSEAYLSELAAEEQERRDQRLLESLIPSADDIRRAETDVQIITLLQEVGLL